MPLSEALAWREDAIRLACALESVLDVAVEGCGARYIPDERITEADAALNAHSTLTDQPTHDDTEVSQ